MAVNVVTNWTGSTMLVPALRFLALPDAAAMPSASQQNASVPLPAPGNDYDISMDLTAEHTSLMSRRRRPGYVLRLGDSNRPSRRELSNTLAVGWSSMSEHGRKSERIVRKSRVRSKLWRRIMPSWLPRRTLPSNSAIEPYARQCARSSTDTLSLMSSA